MSLLLDHKANPRLAAKLKSKYMNAYEMALLKGHEGVAKIIKTAAASMVPEGFVLENWLHKHEPRLQLEPVLVEQRATAQRELAGGFCNASMQCMRTAMEQSGACATQESQDSYCPSLGCYFSPLNTLLRR